MGVHSIEIEESANVDKERLITRAKFKACSYIDRELGLEMPMTATGEDNELSRLPTCSEVGKVAALSLTDAEHVDVVLGDPFPEFESVVVIGVVMSRAGYHCRCGADCFTIMPACNEAHYVDQGNVGVAVIVHHIDMLQKEIL